MASVNKVIIVGNVGKDPEVRYAPSGDAFTSVSLATMEKWKDKSSGQQKEATEWHRIVFFGKLAEIVGQYVKKGSAVYVEGKLRTKKWTNKDNIEQYTTEIHADIMQMLGGEKATQSKEPAEKSATYSTKPKQVQRPLPSTSDMDDDIPF